MGMMHMVDLICLGEVATAQVCGWRHQPLHRNQATAHVSDPLNLPAPHLNSPCDVSCQVTSQRTQACDVGRDSPATNVVHLDKATAVSELKQAPDGPDRTKTRPLPNPES